MPPTVDHRRWIPKSLFRLSHKDHQRPSHQRHHPQAVSAAAKRQSVPIVTPPFQWAQGNVLRVERLSSALHRYESPGISQITNPESILGKARMASMLPFTVTRPVTIQESLIALDARDAKLDSGKELTNG